MNFFSKCKNIEIRNKKRITIKRFLQVIVGCFIMAFSFNLFIAPNNLVPGGLGGISVILNSLFGLDNSLVILTLNMFLLILSHFLLGKEKTKSTIFGALLLPLLIKLTEDINVWIELDTSKILLLAVIGGALYGLGIGLVFKAGFTTGGTDIINQIVCKYGKTSMGKSMLITDGSIILCSAIFFGLNSMLYSILILYFISILSDRIVLGISSNKMFYIITNKEKDIKEYIINELHHGATIFKATGGYKRRKENVIMTIIPTTEYYNFTKGIHNIDKEAIFIATDSYEVFGGE